MHRLRSYLPLEWIIRCDGVAPEPFENLWTNKAYAAWLRAVKRGDIRLITPIERTALLQFKRSVRSVLLALMADTAEREQRNLQTLQTQDDYPSIAEVAGHLETVTEDISALLHTQRLYTIAGYRYTNIPPD